MSVFTSLCTETVSTVDGTITIRKLPPQALAAAQKANLLRSVNELKTMGGPAFLKELQALGGDAAVKAAVSDDPLLLFDTLVLLERGITAWTLPMAKSDEAIADLDDETQTLVATAILRLSKPSLFGAAVAEADQKNA